MAINNVSLLDHAKAFGTDGSVYTVAEILAQVNPMVEDFHSQESNGTLSHKSCIRTGLPPNTWKRFNYGVLPGKSTRATIDDACGGLTARNHVDQDLAELGGNAPAFRLSEATAQIESLAQEMAQTVLYGDSDLTPEKFMGLSPRYSTCNIANGAIANNVIDCGGTGTDNTSLWILGLSPETIFTIFPKGSQAGLKHEDLGLGDVLDPDGGTLRAYRDLFSWKCGLVVKDWRFGVRLCNIDVSNLRAMSGAADLIDLMVDGIHKIPSLGSCSPVIYANRVVRAALDKQALSKSQNALSITEALGQFKTQFLGIPVKTCDAISNAEARVI